jgi:ArsR family transcriptional regulator
MIEFTQNFQEVTVESSDKVAEFLKALAHPTRIRILTYLADGEKCVKEIWQELGIPQPTVSQHINVLKNAGIITFRKDGVKTCYKITDERAKTIIKILMGGEENGY